MQTGDDQKKNLYGALHVKELLQLKTLKSDLEKRQIPHVWGWEDIGGWMGFESSEQ